MSTFTSPSDESSASEPVDGAGDGSVGDRFAISGKIASMEKFDRSGTRAIVNNVDSSGFRSIRFILFGIFLVSRYI